MKITRDTKKFRIAKYYLKKKKDKKGGGGGLKMKKGLGVGVGGSQSHLRPVGSFFL